MATNDSYNRHEFQIDKVLSSQPELGPTVPDGGYGWAILTASVFFKGLIPSLSVGFGVFILFWRLENNASITNPTLWDSKIVYVSLLFTAASIITDPWSRMLCTFSTWPRLVSTAATCLTCAGLLIMWIGIYSGNSTPLFLLAGVLTGAGASIVLAQIEILVSQYFLLKLEVAAILLNAASALGFIFTPIVLGHNIVKLGILQVITWYQAIILQGILISITFKKPKYLKKQRSKYKLIQGLSDDEEDIFAKNITELQNPRPVSSTQTKATIEMSPVNFSVATISTPVSKAEISDTTNTNKKESSNLKPPSWENFDEDASTTQVQKSKKHTSLHESFASECNNDLDRIESFEDSYLETPRPLFSETHINNNTSYSYGAPTEVQDPVVFMPISKSSTESSWRKEIEFLQQPTFYKSLLFIITTKFSVFTFWTLFPTYLYIRIDSLNVHYTTVITGCVGIGSLLFAVLTIWIKGNSNVRAIFLWIFCWMGATGYIVLSDSQKEAALIFGAVNITLSISALQILGMPLMKISLRGESSKAHTILCILTGVSFILFLIINMSYKNCFRFMALLQFLTGSLWFSNFVYKRIKKRMS